MKKIILLIFLLFIIGVVIYFARDNTKLYILKKYNQQAKTYYYFCKNNQLCKIVSSHHIVSYTIDKNGNRIKKFVDGKFIEKYVWQGEGKLYLVADENSNVLREYLYKGEFEKLPFGMIEGDKKYYFVFDKRGSLRVVFNRDKKIVKVLYYNKKGWIQQDTNPSIKVDFSYAGGLWDEEAKLLFYQEGVYDPISSDWISKIKNINIIKNLKELDKLNANSVYICKATIETFYHSYICAKNRCGGLYAAQYLKYFDAKGYILDNSKYFNKDICKKIKLSKIYDKKIFAKCVYKKIIPRPVKYFDAFRHNCHDEIKTIIKFCKKKALKENS